MTTYVYAPFSGTINNLDYYCPDPSDTHTNTGLCGGRPADIFGPQYYPVRFYASSNVKSIRVAYYNGVCLYDPAPWKHGVSVTMYSGLNCTGTNLGCVGYGHLSGRHPEVCSNYPMGRVMGTLPVNCACDCSRGVHVHMECSLPRAFTSPACSHAAVYKNSTAIYAG